RAFSIWVIPLIISLKSAESRVRKCVVLQLSLKKAFSISGRRKFFLYELLLSSISASKKISAYSVLVYRLTKIASYAHRDAITSLINGTYLSDAKIGLILLKSITAPEKRICGIRANGIAA